MAIKVALEKLRLKFPLPSVKLLADVLGIEVLLPGFEEVEVVASLPPHHRDPFDRMLVAQAITHGFTIVTKDQNIPLYGVPVLW